MSVRDCAIPGSSRVVLFPSGRPFLSNFDERLCGNSQPFVQPPNHFECQRPPAIQYFMYTIATADEGNEIARLKSVLVHVIFDRLHWIWEIKWIVVAFPGLDESN